MVADHFTENCPDKKTGVPLSEQVKPPEGYVCKICDESGHFIRYCPQKDSIERRPRVDMNKAPDDCWFCLATPNVATHLIVSIGEELYFTLAKGALVPGTSSYVCVFFCFLLLYFVCFVLLVVNVRVFCWL
jgi:hypothetical protein